MRPKEREFEMPFPAKVLKELREVVWYCEICGEYSEYLEGHSASGLHIVAEKVGHKVKYRAYSTSLGHKALERHHISERMAHEYIQKHRSNDCYMLCPVCHDEIKRIALAQARLEIRGFKGGTPPAELMARVTQDMVKRGKPLHYELRQGGSSSR